MFKFIEDYVEFFRMTQKKILKSSPVQYILCRIITIYIKIVFWTSNVKIVGTDKYLELMKNNKSNFVVTWHGKIFIAPMIVETLVKKIEYKKKPCVLNSKHSDGQLASKVMKLFNFEEIFGSTINQRKLEQAQDSGATKSIIIMLKKIKNGTSIHLSPDGPRGPIRKINSEVTAIAKKTNIPIFPVVIEYSFKKKLKSWDEFQIPLPFGKILCVYQEPIYPNEYNNIDTVKQVLENKMNETFLKK